MIALKSQRKLTRWVKRGLLLAGAALLVLMLALAWMPKPIPADLERVTRGDLIITVDEDGRTRVRDPYLVSAPITGDMGRIDLRPGDPIVRGQTLAWTVPISPALLDARSKAEVEARVNAASAAKRQAHAGIVRAQAVFDFAEKEATRLTSLAKAKTIPPRDAERAAMEHQRAKAALEEAKLAAHVADHELDIARSALGTMSTTKLDRMSVSSPIDGKVLRLIRQSQGVVQMGAPLLEIGDPSRLEIVVDLLTEDATQVRPGDPVSIEAWGGAALTGRVRSIEPAAFTRVSALGVEEQRVNAIIDLDVPREELGDGYRVEVRIEVWKAKNVLLVPASAVFDHQGERAVFAVSNGIVERKTIEVGRGNGLMVMVMGGLVEGDVVVAYPSDAIREGVEVVTR